MHRFQLAAYGTDRHTDERIAPAASLNASYSRTGLNNAVMLHACSNLI